VKLACGDLIALDRVWLGEISEHVDNEAASDGGREIDGLARHGDNVEQSTVPSQVLRVKTENGTVQVSGVMI
jgi:hypothetical protein